MISVVIISKDERALDGTLTAVAKQCAGLGDLSEILVVDASSGRLSDIRDRHGVRWIDFTPPPGVTVSIPHQRNAGVRASCGHIVVFTDSGCQPQDGWLDRLTAPLRAGAEQVVTGRTLAAATGVDPYDGTGTWHSDAEGYVRESPTINLAFRRHAFEAVGGFDESFAYGSDVDFTWRLNDAGYRIRAVPDAVVRADWGTWRRQARRSYVYGKARARLYRKHSARRRRLLRDDPMAVVYPVFILGLPLTLVWPLYPALLLVPAWRNRSRNVPRVLVDHLLYGAGVLAELAGR